MWKLILFIFIIAAFIFNLSKKDYTKYSYETQKILFGVYVGCCIVAGLVFLAFLNISNTLDNSSLGTSAGSFDPGSAWLATIATGIAFLGLSWGVIDAYRKVFGNADPEGIKDYLDK